MNLHRRSLWELKCSQWVRCSHGLAVRGFGQLVTSLKNNENLWRPAADKKSLPVDRDDTRTYSIYCHYMVLGAFLCDTFAPFLLCTCGSG